VDRVSREPCACDRTHARGEIAVVTHEQRARDEPGVHLALGRFIRTDRRDVNAVAYHRSREEWLLRPRRRDDDIRVAHRGWHITMDHDLDT
jgi:hypothetical protein